MSTKMGNRKQPIHIDIVASASMTTLPDFDYQPRMTSAQFIENEMFLFDKGYYNYTINNGYSRISPIIQLLADRRDGIISAQDSALMVDRLKSQDVMADYSRYFYRKSLDQQSQLSKIGRASCRERVCQYV